MVEQAISARQQLVGIPLVVFKVRSSSKQLPNCWQLQVPINNYRVLDTIRIQDGVLSLKSQISDLKASILTGDQKRTLKGRRPSKNI